jgi:hypothetical protein
MLVRDPSPALPLEGREALCQRTNQEILYVLIRMIEAVSVIKNILTYAVPYSELFKSPTNLLPLLHGRGRVLEDQNSINEYLPVRFRSIKKP